MLVISHMQHFYLFEMIFGKQEQCIAAKLQSSNNQCNDGKSKQMNLFFGEPQYLISFC